MKLSVIIPLHRLRSRIAVTLRALERQSLASSSYELIFVDDASPDDTIDVVAAWRPACAHYVIPNVVNQGRSATRNRGVSHASGDVLVFLDGDMIPHPDLLRTYHARFAAGDCDVVSGLRRSIDLSSDPSADDRTLAALAGRRLDTLFDDAHADYAALRARSVVGQLPIGLQGEVERQVEVVCREYPTSLTRALALITSNVAVRRDAFAATRGFFPGLHRFEDTDLGLQLAAAGARFVYERRAEAIHPFDVVNATDRQHADGFAALLARHPFIPVVLWWCWAASGGAAPSLVDIARAEHDGGLDAFDWQALARERGLGVVAHPTITTDALEAYWTSVFDLDAATARAHLARARQEAVLHAREGGVTRFDLAAITAWLAERTDFRQQLHARSFFSRHGVVRTDPAAAPRRIQWHGRYTVELPAAVLGDGDTVVNLPLPVPARCQDDVAVVAWDPPALADHVRDGMIIGFPVPAGAGRGATIGYTFRCRVSELDPDDPPGGGEAPAEGLDVWLRPLAWDGEDELALLERRVAANPTASRFARARAIHTWMLEATEQRANAMHGLMTARTGIGHCIQLTRLFVALCRRAGIPARERCGALIDRVRGDAATPYAAETAQRFSPFAHTWPEAWCDERGWIPFELLPIAHGRRLVTAWSFPDPAARRRVVAEGEAWDAYYAGGLDPFRIHASPRANQLPTVMRDRDGWEAVGDPALAIRHRIWFDGEAA